MEIFVEPILTEPVLIVMGAGHLGQAVANLAGPLQFRTVILDDREKFVSRERFPQADELIVADFSSALEGIEVNDSSYILVVTRGHRHGSFRRHRSAWIGSNGCSD